MIARPQFDYKIVWEPYFLRPNTPEEGLAKPPNTTDNPRVGKFLKSQGIAVGIDFTGKCDVVPNTTRAHVLMSLVSGEKQPELAEKLFHCYFTAGDDVNNIDTLVQCGVAVGLEPTFIKSELQKEQNLKKVKKEASDWSKRGISGVPYFIIGEEQFSGAQKSEYFLAILDDLEKK